MCVSVDVLWIYGCFCAYRTPLTCTFFFFFQNPSMQNSNVWDLFSFFFVCLFIRVSRMCYQMISDELTTTPLGTETAQNHFSTKAERMLLVTNATEYLSVMYVCVCLHIYVCIYVCVCECVCFTVIWRANQERASYTRSHSGSPQKKPSSNNVLLRYTYLY